MNFQDKENAANNQYVRVNTKLIQILIFPDSKSSSSLQ